VKVKNKLHDKIEECMLEIERMMDQNLHLTKNSSLIGLLDSAHNFWSILSEPDREYLECVEYAMQHNIMWET
jgi:hypothetical protein